MVEKMPLKEEINWTSKQQEVLPTLFEFFAMLKHYSRPYIDEGNTIASDIEYPTKYPACRRSQPWALKC